MMLGLQARGCHNINFVTPEHVVPQVLEAVAAAIENGLQLPNPFVIGSGPPGTNANVIGKAFDEGLAAPLVSGDGV